MVLERKALIDPNGVLVNIVVYDPEGNWQVPPGHTLRDPTANEEANWKRDPVDEAWRARLATEIAFVTDQLAAWPADATTSTQAIARVNFLLSATKRIARDLQRVLEYIADSTKDGGA